MILNIDKKTKSISHCIFLISLMFLTTYLVFSALDVDMLTNVVKILDYKYILLGFLFMIMYILLEGQILNLVIKSIHGLTKKSLGFKIGTIGLYYNLITPMASGSQPIQVYELSKANVPTSKATAIVVNKTILFQVAVTLYCGIFILLNLNLLQTQLKAILMLILLGMTMNIVTLCFGFFIVYNPILTKKLVSYVIRFLCNINFFRFLSNKGSDIDMFIDEYNYSVKLFIKNKKSLVKSLALTSLQLTVYFSIAFCISKALNLSGSSYISILSLQVFLYMSVSSMPTPGNIGANEIAFFTIFSGVIPAGLLGYSVFLYGVFVYYFLLIICGLFTILYKANIKSKLSSLI